MPTAECPTAESCGFSSTAYGPPPVDRWRRQSRWRAGTQASTLNTWTVHRGGLKTGRTAATGGLSCGASGGGREESQHKPNQKTLNPAGSATDWGSFRAKGVPGGAVREAETAVRAGESGFWPGGAEARACALWGAGGVAILPHSPEEWIRRRCSFPFGSNLSSHVFPPAHEVGEGPQVKALPQVRHAGSPPCPLQGLPPETDPLSSTSGGQ